MFPFRADPGIAALPQVPLINALSLLLRFANIFFATSAPLFFDRNSALLNSTPLLGLASMGTLGVVLFLPGAAPRLMKLVWVADLACGVLLLALFGLREPAPAWVFALFAGSLGLGLAGTELRAMQLAVQPTDASPLRTRVSWLSFAKSMGLGCGFLLGGAVAGSPRASEPARAVVAVAASIIILLSMALCVRCLWSQAPDAAPAWGLDDTPSQPMAAFGTMGLIALVFLVINLSNVMVPYSLARAMPKEWVGALLSAEALSHGFGALFFRNGLAGAGDRLSYGMGLAGSAVVLLVIAFLPRCGAGAALLLLTGLGLTTAMAYMASTVLFYAAEYPKALYPRVAVQKLASSSGRFLGSWLALRWLASLNP